MHGIAENVKKENLIYQMPALNDLLMVKSIFLTKKKEFILQKRPKSGTQLKKDG